MPQPLFRFCPRCATRLVRRDDHGSQRPTCPACGFIHYRNPVPAAGVVLRHRADVLLVRRKFEPRAGAWCLPAGLHGVRRDARSAARCASCARRPGSSVRLTGLFGVYAGFDDPRVRSVLILYTAERTGGRLKPGDDAIEARFFPLRRLPARIAFASHRQALRELARNRAASG